MPAPTPNSAGASTVPFALALDVPYAIMGGTREAVANRVKQWGRIGVPAGVNTGRGVKADYTSEMLWSLALMAELSRMGFTALVAAKFVQANLRTIIAEAECNDRSAFRFGGCYSMICIDGPDLRRIVADAMLAARQNGGAK